MTKSVIQKTKTKSEFAIKMNAAWDQYLHQHVVHLKNFFIRKPIELFHTINQTAKLVGTFIIDSP